jgi:hypothetical protein
VIVLAGDGVEGGLRGAGLLRGPWPNPRLHAVLKFRDDAVREFLHRIARVALEGAGIPVVGGVAALPCGSLIFRVMRHDVPLFFAVTPFGGGKKSTENRRTQRGCHKILG